MWQENEFADVQLAWGPWVLVTLAAALLLAIYADAEARRNVSIHLPCHTSLMHSNFTPLQLQPPSQVRGLKAKHCYG